MDELRGWLGLGVVFIGSVTGAAVAVHVFVSGVNIRLAEMHAQLESHRKDLDKLNQHNHDVMKEKVAILRRVEMNLPRKLRN